MPFEVEFDQLTSGGVRSTIDKSEVQPMAAYCVDLDKCGTNTHLKTSGVGTFLFKQECSPPRLGYVVSMSSLTALQEVQDALPAVAVPNQYITDVHQWLATAIEQFIATPGTLPAAPTIPALTDPWTIRGNQYITREVNDNVVISLSLARVKQQRDICGAIVAHKANASLSIIAKDQGVATVRPASCRPILLHQLSLGIIVTTDPLAVPNDAASIQPLLTQSQMDQVFGTFAAVPDDASCPTFPNDAFGAVGGVYTLPAELTLGA